MKKFLTTFSFIILNGVLFSQPVLNRDSIRTGLKFDLYSLKNVNTANLRTSGANVTWDLSASNATLAGTAELQDMSSTPYASQYPAANFAIKFTINNVVNYSLFKMSSSAMEEVGNNVNSGGGVPFVDFRTALVFPFTFNKTQSDNYQKMGQGTKTIQLKYDAYGTFITGSGSTNNVMRIFTVDNGDTAANFWGSSPCAPLFTSSINSNSFIYWKLNSTTGIKDLRTNNSISIYPNPVSNLLTVASVEKVNKVEIINLSGVILQTETEGNSIDLSGLLAGIYFVKVQTELGVNVKKFIKS